LLKGFSHPGSGLVAVDAWSWGWAARPWLVACGWQPVSLRVLPREEFSGPGGVRLRCQRVAWATMFRVPWLGCPD
jgi:hypothetical protein